MMKISLILALALVVALVGAEDEDVCSGGVKKWPVKNNCRSYYVCPEKKVESCFPMLRRFNREKLECDWAWRVDCSAVPHAPTGAPSPATTAAPEPQPTSA